MGVTPVVSPEERAHIPEKGPTVVVANHPFGAIEGVILAEILRSVRPDVKIMANFLLERIPQLRELFISVDPFESRKAVRSNIRPIREAIRWVRTGGLLMVFPAGEVAHIHLKKRVIVDPAWNPSVGHIVSRSGASVLPVYFKGTNSPLFQMMGLLHPRLRTALLARELVNKQQKRIELKIGRRIRAKRLKRFSGSAEVIEYLRWRTYLLGNSVSGKGVQGKRKLRALLQRPKRIIHALSPDTLQAEIDHLPTEQKLVESGDFEVWQAEADQIPQGLVEIGRLREICFREAAEGTGEPLDLDMFDTHYTHIFIWNRQSREIAGAYRLGRTDRILNQYGKGGLYTSTLFRTSRKFYKTIGPALEMGRSFVRTEYQKSYAPLLLLWKGIGHYILKHPQYRMLFGPVSISRDYSDISRRLIATTLLRHNSANEIASMITPKRPPALKKPMRLPGFDPKQSDRFCQDMEEVCSVIADIEMEQKSIPVLLRQYLNLGGRLLAFNIDHSFSDAMDGLILVDLIETDPKTLSRYMGKTGTAEFRAYHQEQTAHHDTIQQAAS
jgi:putative hemolysin